MVAIVAADGVDASLRLLEAQQQEAWVIGSVGADTDQAASDVEVIRGAKGVQGGGVRLLGRHPAH